MTKLFDCKKKNKKVERIKRKLMKIKNQIELNRNKLVKKNKRKKKKKKKKKEERRKGMKKDRENKFKRYWLIN